MTANDFSGICYRLIAVCGLTMIVSLIPLLIDAIRRKRPKRKEVIFVVCADALLLVLACVYTTRIVFPHVEMCKATYRSEYRDSSVAPPLPFTYAYEFDDTDTGKTKEFYLDVFSKRSVYPDDFVPSRTYFVYYDTFTKVIVRVETVQDHAKKADNGGD